MKKEESGFLYCKVNANKSSLVGFFHFYWSWFIILLSHPDTKSTPKPAFLHQCSRGYFHLPPHHTFQYKLNSVDQLSSSVAFGNLYIAPLLYFFSCFSLIDITISGRIIFASIVLSFVVIYYVIDDRISDI